MFHQSFELLTVSDDPCRVVKSNGILSQNNSYYIPPHPNVVLTELKFWIQEIIGIVIGLGPWSVYSICIQFQS